MQVEEFYRDEEDCLLNITGPMKDYAKIVNWLTNNAYVVRRQDCNFYGEYGRDQCSITVRFHKQPDLTEKFIRTFC